MPYRTHTDYPAGFVVPGDRLMVAEGEAVEVVEVHASEDRPTSVVLHLEDGREVTYPEPLQLTVEVYWKE